MKFGRYGLNAEMQKAENKMKEFIDKTQDKSGTPLNRNSLMAIQGFIEKNITFIGNKIIETNSNGEVLTTTFNNDGSIEQTFAGQKTITKKITFNESGSITEEII